MSGNIKKNLFENFRALDIHLTFLETFHRRGKDEIWGRPLVWGW